MEMRDKIELALRSAVIARDLLGLTTAHDKFYAQVVMREVTKQLGELAKRIEEMRDA
jgi:hypothetical protein